MKTGRSLHILGQWLGLIALGFLAGTVRLPAGELLQPVITSIRLDTSNVVVTANVPSGVLLATLEGRQRLGAGSWEPRAHPDGRRRRRAHLPGAALPAIGSAARARRRDGAVAGF